MIASIAAPAPVTLIGTRASKLALWQTEHVRSLLLARNPGLDIEYTRITTKGGYLQIALFQETWGRRIVGIKVVNGDTGMPLGYGRSLGRMLGSAISAWVCYLGYLWMLWDGNKQTWHDKMVGSIVVKA